MFATTATLPDETTTSTTTARGFSGLPCPKCSETDCVSIDLHDLTGDEACRCCQCDATFGLDEVRELMTKWTAVLKWVEMAPKT